jgi:RNA polymerase sigma factor (sigma-70 family)
MGDDLTVLNDAELVGRSANKDTQAFEELVRRYYPKIRQLVQRMTRNADDAADVTQDIFVKAYLALPGFKGDSSFYTWIYRIAVNHTLNFLKKRALRSAASMDDTDQGIERRTEYIERAGAWTPDREVTVSEIQDKLNAALAKLSEKHRTVVVLHDIQGVPHEEIAKMLRCSAGTVRSRLFYARKQLQKELAEFIG